MNFVTSLIVTYNEFQEHSQEVILIILCTLVVFLLVLVYFIVFCKCCCKKTRYQTRVRIQNKHKLHDHYQKISKKNVEEVAGTTSVIIASTPDSLGRKLSSSQEERKPLLTSRSNIPEIIIRRVEPKPNLNFYNEMYNGQTISKPKPEYDETPTKTDELTDNLLSKLGSLPPIPNRTLEYRGGNDYSSLRRPPLTGNSNTYTPTSTKFTHHDSLKSFEQAYSNPLPPAPLEPKILPRRSKQRIYSKNSDYELEQDENLNGEVVGGGGGGQSEEIDVNETKMNQLLQSTEESVDHSLETEDVIAETTCNGGDSFRLASIDMVEQYIDSVSAQQKVARIKKSPKMGLRSPSSSGDTSSKSKPSPFRENNMSSSYDNNDKSITEDVIQVTTQSASTSVRENRTPDSNSETRQKLSPVSSPSRSIMGIKSSSKLFETSTYDSIEDPAIRESLRQVDIAYHNMISLCHK